MPWIWSGGCAGWPISKSASPPIPRAIRGDVPDADLDNLKRKIDAGASRAISQFFFDTDKFLRFLERAGRAGITVPIVPGILPITNFTRTVDMAGKCGASIPPWFADAFDGLDQTGNPPDGRGQRRRRPVPGASASRRP